MSAIVTSLTVTAHQGPGHAGRDDARGSRSHDSHTPEKSRNSAALTNNFVSPIPEAPGRPSADAGSVPGPTGVGNPSAPSAEDDQPQLRALSGDISGPGTPTSRQHSQVVEAVSWQQTLYITLEEPQAGCASQVVSYVVLSTICISIVSFVLEAEPALSNFEGWKYIEIFCTVIFTVEYVLRFIVCNAFDEMTRCEFLRAPMNVMDVFAILPWYMDSALQGMDLGPFRILRSVRLIRIFRIFRLSKYSMGMALMLQSLIASIQPLAILLFFLFVGVTLFSSMIYYAEKMFCPDMQDISDAVKSRHFQDCVDADWDSDGKRCCDKYGAAINFESILDSAWWAIVSMTTVGYGDKAPKTKLGHLIGVATMICGIVLISLPVAIVGSKFQSAYEAAEMERERVVMEEKDRKAMEAASKVHSEGADVNRVAKLLSHETRKSEALKEEQADSHEQVVPMGTDLDEEAGKTVSKIVSSPKIKAPDEMASSKSDEGLKILEKASQLRESLRKLDHRTTLSGAARDQIRLILTLLEHIDTTETKLAKLREKDAAMEACICQTFTHLCRTYEMSRRQVQNGELRPRHLSSGTSASPH